MSYTFLYLSLHFNQSPITDLLLDKIIWYGSLDTIFSSVLTNSVFFYFQFQEILKPNYNSVDLTEVELVDSYNSEPRGNDTQLLAVSILYFKVCIAQCGNSRIFVPPKFSVKSISFDEVQLTSIATKSRPITNAPTTTPKPVT